MCWGILLKIIKYEFKRQINTINSLINTIVIMDNSQEVAFLKNYICFIKKNLMYLHIFIK